MTPAAGPSSAAGAVGPASRPVASDLSLTGTALWDGLRDRGVRLSLRSGSTLSGTVVAQDGSSLALARASDGLIVSVPKAEIAGVATSTLPGARDRGSGPSSDPASRPRDDGRKAHAGGAVLLAFGVPFGLAGTVMLGTCPGCLYIHLPLLLPGIGMIVGGSIALKRAKKKRAAFNQAWGIPLSARVRMTPSLAASRGGGEMGFTLRF